MEWRETSLAHFTNSANFDIQINIHAPNPEFLPILKVLFARFDSFTQKSEQLGKIKIDQWAQIQTLDGKNAISNLLCWTTYISLNVSFPFFL